MRRDYRFGATDSFVTMPDGTQHYIFGFVDITGVPEHLIYSHRGRSTLPAPLLESNQGDEVFLTLTNLGLPVRPDLDDSHTVHWHGFVNQIPLWDGVPEVSIAVPVGRDFVYYYAPRDPGTYMYHCHFEPVEHIQMGMVGPVVVRPALEQDPAFAGRKFVYNDPATEFDREYLAFLTELDPVPHDLVANVQEFDWSEYAPRYWLLNGRAYPDTAADPDSLPQQPVSARFRANAGDRVLLRCVNLGFQTQAVQTLGIPLWVAGLDAQRLRGLHGEDLSRFQDVIHISPGQTADVLFTAPGPGLYPFCNRAYHRNNNAGQEFGGMVTLIEVFRPGTLGPQAGLNR